VAVLSAVIRHLDHAAHKHLPAKNSIARCRRARMKRFLRLDSAIYPQKVLPQTTHGLSQDSGLPPKHNSDFGVFA
jgi:hypothetical protein